MRWSLEKYLPVVCFFVSRLRGPASSTGFVDGEGFEPSKPVATDLQSVPFDRSGTRPGDYVRKAHSARAIAHQAPSWRRDLNPQPADYKSAALPVELRQRSIVDSCLLFLALSCDSDEFASLHRLA